MSGLYPIVRRARRPLLPPEEPKKVEPAQATVEKPKDEVVNEAAETKENASTAVPAN